MSGSGSRRGGSRHSQESELRACVRRTMETYFDNLDGIEADGVFSMVMTEVEVPLLQVVLERAQGNQTRAARMLGINRGTLRRKMHDHGLE